MTSKTIHPDLLVIGTASTDRLHIQQQAHQTIGGAGLYTALAGQATGAEVGLFAPRPEPLSADFTPVDERLTWLGPAVEPEDLPRLEIAHYGGGRAELLEASWGGEEYLLPDDLPDTLLSAPIIHIAALSSAERQLNFLLTLFEDERVEALISVGTYGKLVYENLERVQQIFELADIFFMNENEAKGMFERVAQAKTQPDALLFITLGENGAILVEGEQHTHIPGTPVAEIDPTGAGDTFCGATLAGIALGLSPLEAAQQAISLAAKNVQTIGPGALV